MSRVVDYSHDWTFKWWLYEEFNSGRQRCNFSTSMILNLMVTHQPRRNNTPSKGNSYSHLRSWYKWVQIKL